MTLHPDIGCLVSRDRMAAVALLCLVALQLGCRTDDDVRAEKTRFDVAEIHRAMLRHLSSGRPCSPDTDWEKEIGDQYPLSALKGTGPRPSDAWHRPFVMKCTPEGPVAMSLGADGVPGGTGVDADIVVRSEDRLTNDHTTR